MSSLADRLLQNQPQQTQNHYILPKKPNNSPPEYIHMYDGIPEECRRAASEFSDNFNTLLNSSYQSKTTSDEKCNTRKDISIGISGLSHDMLSNPMAFRDENNYRMPFPGNWNSNSDFCGKLNILGNQNGESASNFNKSVFFDPSSNVTQEKPTDILPEEGINCNYSELAWQECLDPHSNQKVNTGWSQLLTTIKPKNFDSDAFFKQSDLEKNWRSRTSSEMDHISPDMKRVTPQSFDEKSNFLLQSQAQHWSNSAPLDSIGIPNAGGICEFNIDEGGQSTYPDDSLSSIGLGRPVNLDQFTQFNAPSIDGYQQKPFLCNTRNNLPYNTNDDSSTDNNSSLNEEHLWLYKDPQGRIQGEFCDTQMNGWLLAGQYFTPSLRIRRKCDDTFSKLSDYINLFGRVPFIAGPRIPPFQGGISQDMVTKVRTLLAMQQAALFDAISANLPVNLRQQFSQSSLITSLPTVEVPRQDDVVSRCTDDTNVNPNNPVGLNQPFTGSYSNMPCQIPGDDQNGQLQALALAQLLCNSSLNPQNSFEWSLKSPYTDLVDLANQQLSSSGDYATNSCPVPMNNFASTTSEQENTNKTWKSSVNPGKESTMHEKATKSRSKVSRKKKSATSSLPTTETRSESQSGRNSSNSSSVWARSSDSLLDSNSKCLHSVAAVTGSSAGLETTNSILSKTPAKGGASKKSRRKAGLRCDQNLEDNVTPSSSPFSTSDTSKFNSVPKKNSNAVDKKLQKNTKSHQPTENGVLPNASAAKMSNSNKMNKSSQLSMKSSEELCTLVRWVQDALKGIELSETVDIPTFVELLTTIDAPYEVESMLIAYIGNSKRSAQFVKEFLVRRHTCWQFHRKHVEEMAVLRNSSKKQTSQAPTTVSTATSENVIARDAFSKIRIVLDAPPSTESPWQQIKVKNNSSRRSKKSKAHS